MLALSYQNLPDIDAVEPLGEADLRCLAEVRDVLARHHRLNRFGVSLLHTHFPISEDEVLVETCDQDERSLTMKVQPKTVLTAPDVVATSWRLTDGEAILGCYQACVAAGGSHKRRHVER